MAKSGRYSADRKKIEALSAAKTIEVHDCGTIFMLSSNNYTITLPSAAAAGKGWWCKLVAGADIASNDIVVTAAGSDTIEVVIVTGADGTATDQTGTGQLEFKGGAAKKGDQIELFTDGTSWYGLGFCVADDGIDANS